MHSSLSFSLHLRAPWLVACSENKTKAKRKEKNNPKDPLRGQTCPAWCCLLVLLVLLTANADVQVDL
jgi:hypothetical protein